MPRRFKINIGEKMLCYHGPLIYEAKCLQAVKNNDGSVIYLIHYVGWNKRWDEWVCEERVLRYNKSNLNKQAKLKMAYMSQSSVRKPRSKKQTTHEHNTSKEENQGIENNPPGTIPFVNSGNTILDKIGIPEELKDCLVDDWDLVYRQKKLVILPEKHNLSNILKSFLVYKSEVCPSENWREDVGREVILGLETYFTTVLYTQLLYDIERPQYNEIISKFKEIPVQRIYGGIHVLRLFGQLGPLLSYSPNMAEENTVYFEELLEYLLLLKSEIFGIEHYISEDYLRTVQ